jgi:hypothetical protein
MNKRYMLFTLLFLATSCNAADESEGICNIILSNSTLEEGTSRTKVAISLENWSGILFHVYKDVPQQKNIKVFLQNIIDNRQLPAEYEVPIRAYIGGDLEALNLELNYKLPTISGQRLNEDLGGMYLCSIS